MARFRGTLRGSRGVASRLGTPNSGLTVQANGWDVGVTVELTATAAGDEVRIYATGGSNGSRVREIGSYDAEQGWKLGGG